MDPDTSRSDRLMTLYELMLKAEKRLDHAITQKKMAVEEAHFKKIKKVATVRINILLERTSEDTLFILIGGKVKEDPSEYAEGTAEIKPIGSVLNRLFVELSSTPGESSGAHAKPAEGLESAESGEEGRNRVEMANTGGDAFFEWHNRAPPSNVSEFEIKTSEKASHGKVFLSFISYTGVYEVCAELAQAIGISRGSRPAILLGLWKYITAQKMRDPGNQKIIFCNDIFKKVFSQEQITFTEIIQRLDQYLSPVDMVAFDFLVPTQAGSKTRVAYDITTELDPLNKEYAYSNGNKISILNRKIEDILLRIEKQSEKVEALEKFIENPREYITNWLQESSKELHLIADDLFDVNDGFYTQKEIQESVYQLLQNYK
ncbi:SWI/SNF-related matrix-associated actin-dependent regulator of chromatin subfamily D [Nematocida major]|uniref:SWI/SNF-related matrix-associated actin-dependent regulator of chromatin subfamily D n=1 Tax=Nematocida major TaxID=1912982 RepID=UPI002007BCA3|nr:SWI/SNF-related matrix-associated actin-dependent regulator of chromatin subfamily D [Nematocida major]KAH9387402.1 SWI/SNF-related matrix-associated actin-dependent regulator of chromatin subfamily D [Nematocida major]